MKLTKWTTKKAEQLGLDIIVVEYSRDEGETVYNRVEIYGLDEDGEPHDEYTAAYRVTDKGLFFNGGCFDTEDMPHWIEDEKKLREMLPAFKAMTPD